jgi:hypothetical protein
MSCGTEASWLSSSQALRTFDGAIAGLHDGRNSGMRVARGQSHEQDWLASIDIDRVLF